jgi:hypothetical protein
MEGAMVSDIELGLEGKPSIAPVDIDPDSPSYV